MRNSPPLGTLLRSVLLAAFCAASALAVEPTVRTVSIRGWQIGGTTELIVDGDDLTDAPKLLLPFAATQELKPGSTEKKGTFIVTLGNDVAAGYYQLRIATAGGVSLPIVIGVDRLPQQVIAAPVEKLPVAVHGNVSGSSTAEFRFKGKKGEPVAIEVEAQRFGSKLRPVIHLYEAQGKQLAWAWPQPTLFGDARLETTLPDDGEYRVTCHDVEYAAASPNYFRLKIGQWTRVEQIFPGVVAAGSAQPVEVRTRSASLQMTVDAQASQPFARLPVTPTDLSGPQPFVRVSSHREVLETAAAAGEHSLATGPLGISGQLREPGEEDRYLLAVKPGDKIRCEIFAQRHGSAIDCKLILRNEQDAIVAQAEDSPGSLDPLLEYTVPDKVTLLKVCVIDSQNRGGLQTAYHLTLRNVNDSAVTANEYRLLSNVDRTAIPKSGRWIMPVWLDRRGYLGPAEISAQGLPPGLSLSGNRIPAGSDGTLITITADDAETAGGQLAAITVWQGEVDGKTKPVTLKNHPLEIVQPWLAEEIAIARVNLPAADFGIDWREFPETAALQPTAKLPLPIKVSRIDDKSAVRLSLITSQLITLNNNNQPDPRTTIRAERAVELGAKMNDGELTVLVPADLPGEFYDVAVQAELLSADKQKVLATAFTPVRRLAVQLPVELRLAGDGPIDVMLDSAKGGMHKIEGTIQRREGITGDVVITLTGLPSGVRADSPTVKADATSFTLTITLPPSQAAGEIKDLKLTATIAPDPKQANVRVKSREVDLKLNIIRPAT